MPNGLTIISCACGTLLAIGDRDNVASAPPCPTCALKAELEAQIKTLSQKIERLRLPPPSSRDF